MHCQLQRRAGLGAGDNRRALLCLNYGDTIAKDELEAESNEMADITLDTTEAQSGKKTKVDPEADSDRSRSDRERGRDKDR